MKDSVRKYLLGAAAGLTISLAGLFHVYESEGIRYTAYRDAVGVVTICNGHTGADVRMGMTVTADQCAKWLHDDVAKAEAVLRKTVKVSMMQGEWDAATSFVFNLGEGKWRGSTLLDLLNKGQHKAACMQYPRWKYANKMVLEGLVVRRTKEEAMCLKPGATVYVPTRT